MAAKQSKTADPIESKVPHTGFYLFGEIARPRGRGPKMDFPEEVHLTIEYVGKGQMTDEQAAKGVAALKEMVGKLLSIEAATTNSFKKKGKWRHDALLTFGAWTAREYRKLREEVLAAAGLEVEMEPHRWRPHLTILSSNTVDPAEGLVSKFNSALSHSFRVTHITTSCSPGATKHL